MDVQKRRSWGHFEHENERIYYESIGNGPALVLCHGLGGNHASWFQQVGPLSDRFQIVTWDQRGFGNSTRATGIFGPAPAVGDLIALLDHLEISRAHVLGQSMGGWVAMGAAVTDANRVKSLILTDTLAGVYTEEIEDIVSQSIGRVISQLQPDAVAVHPALGESFMRRNPERAFLYQQISSFGDKPDDAEMFGLLSETRWSLDLVSTLGMPTMLIVGSEDRLCPPPAMKLIADRIPTAAALHVLPGFGHSPYFEAPGDWNDLVLDFLGGLEPDERAASTTSD